MKKKSVLLVALSLMMVAAIATATTLAYFTDTKTANNTFTMGNVAIELVEKDAEGNDFVQDQLLMPGVANKVDKVVTVKNTGANDAYIWVQLSYDAELDGNLMLNLLTNNGWLEMGKLDNVEGKTVVTLLYNNDVPVTAKTGETPAVLDYVYMNAGVTQNADGKLVLTDGTVYEGKWAVDVTAYAIQADGFTTARDAFNAYYEA